MLSSAHFHNLPIQKEGMRKIFSRLFLFFAVFAAAHLYAAPALQARDVQTRSIEDDSHIRRRLESEWFRESPVSVLARAPEIHTLRSGTRVQVRTETSAQNPHEFAVVLAREQYGTFPGWAQGSWVLTRLRDTPLHYGSRIRIFLRSDFNTFVQFRPLGGGERSQMDVVIYDAYMVRSLPIPIPFERLFVLPVENALSAAGTRFPRHYFDPDLGRYRDSRAFVNAVRSQLPQLRFADDGAIDENGNFVFINGLAPQNSETQGLNCSGFVKWIIDGILRPVTGRRLPIRPLAEPFGDRGGISIEHWEQLRDPFFGLDWIRNLAANAGTVLRSPSFANLSEIEVRNWSFSQIISRRGGVRTVQQYRGFLENAGFCIEGIRPLMYSLAINEPGWIYLAAVNDEWGAERFDGFDPTDLRGLPRLRQFFHVAVLVPFFDERGNFQVVVFESAAETSFQGFSTRYPGHFVSLVRVPIHGRFDP